LRADFLGAYAGDDALPDTPFLDGLAASSLVFDAAHATAPWTQPSLASTLTGKWPWQHGVTRLLAPLGDGHRTLAEAFDEGGWHTGGVMTNFLIRKKGGYAQGFDLWSEDLARGHEGLSAEAAVDELLVSLDTLTHARVSPDEPIFLFGFFFEPHWRYEPSDKTRDLGVTRFSELKDLRAALAAGQLSVADLAELRQLYAGEVERIDHALARLAAELEKRGLWDDAVVIFTADHGEQLGESTWGADPWVGHTVDLSETLTRVPLWIKAPGLAPGREARPVSAIDVGATALDLAGLEGKLGEGRSLFAKTPRERLFMHVDFEPALVQAGSERKRTLMWGVVDATTRHKWVVDHLAEGGPRGIEFDLATDPREETPLPAGPITPTLQTLLGLVPADLNGRRGETPSQP